MFPVKSPATGTPALVPIVLFAFSVFGVTALASSVPVLTSACVAISIIPLTVVLASLGAVISLAISFHTAPPLASFRRTYAFLGVVLLSIHTSPALYPFVLSSVAVGVPLLGYPLDALETLSS